MDAAGGIGRLVCAPHLTGIHKSPIYLSSKQRFTTLTGMAGRAVSVSIPTSSWPITASWPAADNLGADVLEQALKIRRVQDDLCCCRAQAVDLLVLQHE